MNSNKEEYISFCEQEERLPIFFQAWWLNAVCNNEWDVAISHTKDGKIRGVMPFTKLKKYSISLSIPPQLTPYLGPYLVYPANASKNTAIYSFELKVMDDLIAQLPSGAIVKYSMLPEVGNWLAFYNNGYTQTSRISYRIKENKIDEAWNKLKYSVRNDIRKAENSIEIRTNIDSKLLYELSLETFGRKEGKIPYSESFFSNLVSNVAVRKKAKMYTAYLKNEATASILIVNDEQYSYLLIVGLNKEKSIRGTVQLLIWEAIKDAIPEKRYFDFEGSMIPEIEPVFRAFGGEMTPYNSISKAPKWFDILYKLKTDNNF